jgi:hypothetical protein
MFWLNAALAFSVTMLVLSMVTSAFVETIHRLLGMRVKGLRLMLGHFFDRVIASHYPDAEANQLQKLKSEFIEQMTVNRAPTGSALKGEIDRSDDGTAEDESLLRWPWQGRRLASLDVNNFMARLGGSEFGETIRANGSDATVDVIKDMAQKFDAFGNEASEFFQRRARLLSIIVAMFVAWGMFVHPYQLFTTYMQRPEVADAVIKMQQGATADFLSRQRSAEDKMEAAKAANDEEAVQKASAEWRDATVNANAKLATLQQAGVPIGWNDERLAASGFEKSTFLWLVPFPMPAEWTAKSRATIFWLFLGGLLIGLGGPFWYRTITSLTNIRALTGAAGTASQKSDSSVSEVTDSQPQTPVDHFMTAASSRDATTGGGAGESADEEAVG